MRLGIYGAAAGSEDTARLNSQGELLSALFLLSCDFLHLSKVIGFLAMSCLDVMYHQSYGAHYLPAAAYKATYYNHHQQQQQVRRWEKYFFAQQTKAFVYFLSEILFRFKKIINSRKTMVMGI